MYPGPWAMGFSPPTWSKAGKKLWWGRQKHDRHLSCFCFVGLRGIEPRQQDPQPCVLPLYDSPKPDYFADFLIVRKHWVQISFRLPPTFAY